MLDYQSSGVNIENGNKLVEAIGPTTQKTLRKEVIGGIGGFGALFELDTSKYEKPILVSTTDGVGTKLRISNQLSLHQTIGIDLVAMCVNDLITLGAEPLFFLDYYATGSLSVNVAQQVISGIAEGCLQSGAALVGGETAEMPGMYSGADYDLAGFCVGVVEKDRIISGDTVKEGDQLIALASSGVHSNGFSLIRKILADKNIPLKHTFDQSNQTIGQILLTPTTIYVKPILDLLQKIEVKAIAHITGGGLVDNIPRVLPKNTKAVINETSWDWPELFQWLQIQGNVATTEMYRTFNCGVGMVLCVDESDVEPCLQALKSSETDAWVIGEIAKSDTTEPFVEFTK